MSEETPANPSSNAPQELVTINYQLTSAANVGAGAPPRLFGGVVDLSTQPSNPLPELPTALPVREAPLTISLNDALSQEIDGVLQSVEPGHANADVYFRMGAGLYVAAAYRVNEHFEIGGIARATQREHELHIDAAAKLRISF